MPEQPTGGPRTITQERGLRMRTLGVVFGVAVIPLLVVVTSDMIDASVGLRLARSVEVAVEEAAAGEPGSAAYDAGVWLRSVTPSGVDFEVDHESRSTMVRQLSDLWLGAEAVDLGVWDAHQPEPGARDVVQRARVEGRASRCGMYEAGALQVCEAALRTDSGTVWVAQKAARRGVTALSDVRWQMLRMSFIMLAVALAAGWWLGRRWSGPIEVLRQEALSRTARPLSAPPLHLEKMGEFTDLAEAFNVLLAAVRERAGQNEAFVADLAHEMKNPVAAIRAAAESIEGAGDISSERGQRYARILDDSSRRLDALVTRLLELARAEAGLAAEAREAIRLDELVQGVVDDISADPRYAHLSVVVQAEAVMVTVAVGGVESAVRNLVDNACSFAKAEVWVVVERRSREARVVVTDDGTGIAPEVLPRVFDRFFTTRGERRGTGLGLALVRAIAEAHGGEVGAESPAGARLWIVLPTHGHSVA